MSGYFVITLILAGFAVLAWRRFQWAVATVLAFLPLAAIRFYVGALALNMAEAATLILAACFALQVFSKRFWGDVRSVVAPIALPIAAILAGLAIATLQSPVLRSSLAAVKVVFVIPMLLGIMIAVAVRRGDVRAGQVCGGLIAGGAGVALGATLQLVAGNLTADGRLAGWYDSPSALAMYLAPLVVLAFGLGRRGSGIANEWRTLSRWAGVLMTVPFLATQSWGAIGAALLVLAAGLWFGRSGHAQRRKIAAAGVLAVVLAGFAFQVREPAFTTRRVIWQVAFEIGRDHPVWGIGPGAFQAAYLANQPKHPPYPEWAVRHPHNVFFTFWLEAGLLGLAGFVWLLVVLLRRLRPAFAKTNTTPFLGAVGLALFVPVAHGFLDTTIWHGDLALVWWVLVGLLLAMSRNVSSK
ncbi:O-antigen ligase family protein [Candidatus Parcubacteria bacterium]|nr:O-antigen ligase family protein [Candidatus Parcubacteria bacterium]